MKTLISNTTKEEDVAVGYRLGQGGDHRAARARSARGTHRVLRAQGVTLPRLTDSLDVQAEVRAPRLARVEVLEAPSSQEAPWLTSSTP
jgi:hypothetical protein